MSSVKAVIFAILAVVGLIVVGGSLFTVHQTQQALVLQLGNPKQVITEPGLHFKIPVIQNVLYLDARVLDLDPPALEMPLADQRRVVVDAFARYRIEDPLLFYQTVRNEFAFRDRFGTILNSSVRNALGRAELPDLLTERRAAVMDEITASVQQRAPEFGVEVVEVRIGRTDLPGDTLEALFQRMIFDRRAEAAEFRASGQETKQRIEAEADRERTVILAEAQRQAEILLGEGEAESRRVLNDAHGVDPEFFSFMRSMQAYRESIDEGTTMVLSPDSEFFQYFNQTPQR